MGPWSRCHSTWLWNEHRDIRSARAAFDAWYGVDRPAVYWALPIGDPGLLNLFATQVYNRGAGTLHALRVKIGNQTFIEVTRAWVARYDDSHRIVDSVNVLDRRPGQIFVIEDDGETAFRHGLTARTAGTIR